MKAIVIGAVAALAIGPALTSAAVASPVTGGAMSYSDYTADPSSLAADNGFHTVTGATIASYCHGSRVPSAPQDVNEHLLTVTSPSVLKMQIAASGAWGLDVAKRNGAAVAAVATTRTTALTTRLRPGTYVVRACNLGGAPTAHVNYRVVR